MAKSRSLKTQKIFNFKYLLKNLLTKPELSQVKFGAHAKVNNRPKDLKIGLKECVFSLNATVLKVR